MTQILNTVSAIDSNLLAIILFLLTDFIDDVFLHEISAKIWNKISSSVQLGEKVIFIVIKLTLILLVSTFFSKIKK